MHVWPVIEDTMGGLIEKKTISSLQVHDIKAESKLDANLDNTQAKSMF